MCNVLVSFTKMSSLKLPFTTHNALLSEVLLNPLLEICSAFFLGSLVVSAYQELYQLIFHGTTKVRMHVQVLLHAPKKRLKIVFLFCFFFV